jgi:hypothetical protein
MHLNRKRILLFCVGVVLLMSLLITIIFWPNDGRSKIIQSTISELNAEAKSWDSYPSDEAHSYLAPAFRKAIPSLEINGPEALPMMLAATFQHGKDSPINVTGWTFVFHWLEIGDVVRGFYLRSEGEPDIYVLPYQLLFKQPQVPGTAWMIAAGPIVQNTMEQSKIPKSDHGLEIFVDAKVLEQKNLLVGLILADGRKTTPVQAYFDEWKKETGEK